METSSWNCCRMCLSADNLNPIFTQAEHHEIYSNVVLSITGVKVDLNDNLPQEMCSRCINFINDSIRFRKKCEETNMQLLSRLNDKNYINIKLESVKIVNDNEKIMIDVSHLIPDVDNNFKDYDDNMTLDSLNNEKYLTDNGRCDEISDNKKAIDLNGDENANGKPKRKLKSSKKNGIVEKKKEKTERTREKVKCEFCDKIMLKKSLRGHYKRHEGFDVVCEHCGKKCLSKPRLLEHCRAKHGYEKTHKCSYCDYKGSNGEQVKIHERLHTGERPYVCGECNAGFHRKSSYLQHVAIHLPEKTVQCEQCPARFKSATLMRIHRGRHRAPTHSFWCRVCEHSFARRRNVAQHLQRVHKLPPDGANIDKRKIELLDYCVY